MLVPRWKEADRYVELEVRGKLTRTDYERLVPRLEEAIREHGKLRMLIVLEDFHGWTPQALVDELRFDLRHRKDFERIAVVGETKLQEWKTKLCAPFFGGEMRFFEDVDAARAWLR